MKVASCGFVHSTSYCKVFHFQMRGKNVDCEWNQNSLEYQCYTVTEESMNTFPKDIGHNLPGTSPLGDL